jgi:hypothetical protein
MKPLLLLAVALAALSLWGWWAGRRLDRWLWAVPRC